MASRNYRNYRGDSRIPAGTQPQGLEEQLQAQDAVSYNAAANEIVARAAATGRTPSSVRRRLDRLRGMMEDKARTDAAGLAPDVRAREAEAAALNESVEAELVPGAVAPGTRPAPGSWRVSARPGVGFEKYSAERGGFVTVTNRNGSVESDFIPYAPPPVDRGQSFAEALRTDIPKRQEAMRRYLAAGDIAAAQKERDAIDEYSERYASDLHRVSRFTGDDRYLRLLSDRALGLATGTWLSDEEKALFVPAANPAYRSAWSRRAGAGPLLEGLLRRADTMTDPAAADKVAALGVALGSAVPEVAPGTVSDPAVSRRVRAESPEAAALPTPADAEAYLAYEAGALSNVFGAVQVSPRDAASVLGPLFRAGDHEYLGGQLSTLVGQIAETDPGLLRSASRSVAESWLPAWSSGRPGDVLHRRMFANAVEGVADAFGGDKRRLAGASDLVASALRQVAGIVGADPSGGPADPAAVRRLAKVYAARASGRQDELSGDEAALSASLAAADSALANLTVSVPAEAGLPEADVTAVDPDTGERVRAKRPASADEVYPKFASLKGGMARAMAAAKARVAADPKVPLGDALAAGSAFVEDLLVLPGELRGASGPPPADPARARRAAAELLLKGWAANPDRPFDLRKAHETLVAGYGARIVKEQVADKTVAVAEGGGAKASVEAEAAAKAAAPQSRFTLQAKLYSNILDRGVNVGGETRKWKADALFDPKGWDWAWGDKRVNQLRALAREGVAESIAEVMSPGTKAADFVASLPVSDFTEKARAATAEAIAGVVAPELRASFGDALASQALEGVIPVLAKAVADRTVQRVSAVSGVRDVGETSGKLPVRDAAGDAFPGRLGDPDEWLSQTTVAPDMTDVGVPPTPGSSGDWYTAAAAAVGSLVSYLAPVSGHVATIDAKAKLSALMAVKVPEPPAGRAEEGDGVEYEYTAEAPDLMTYNASEQAAAFDILKRTAEAAEAPVNDAMKAQMLSGLDDHTREWVLNVAADLRGGVDGMSTGTLRGLIGNIRHLQKVREAEEKQYDHAAKQAIDAEFKVLLAKTVPTDDAPAELSAEDFRRASDALVARYRPR